MLSALLLSLNVRFLPIPATIGFDALRTFDGTRFQLDAGSGHGNGGKLKKALVVTAAAALAACSSKVADTIAAPHLQVAELNHVFTTVDAETANAIQQSEFLRRFANLEIRTTTGTRATWTGRYLYGAKTYIEILAPNDFQINDHPAPVGSWGIALSGDKIGFNRELSSRLSMAGHTAFTEMETRTFGQRSVPWFEALTSITEHGDSGDLGKTVTVWAMEYQPSYFEIPEAEKEPAESPNDMISRERYQSDQYRNRIVRDIAHVTFDVGRRDFARIEPLLRAAGYHIERKPDHFVAAGVETSFRFNIVGETAHRLREVRFVLNAPAAHHSEAIGRSTIVTGPGARAVWTFHAPR